MPDFLPPDFPAILEAFEVPGAALAVVKDDTVLFAGGFGRRGLADPRPVDEHTLFAAGSISKSFTAASLARLVGEGRLRWDDPAADYLPGFQLADAFATRELTIRDLLTHRCGLPEVSGGTIWYGSRHSRAEVLRRLRYLRPAASFRGRFAYQNVMYLAAGEIIPAVTGLSWDAFVRDQIFAPLGMAASNTSIQALPAGGNVAQPHARVQGVVQAVPHRNYDNVGPAASLNTSATDLLQYLRLYLNGGQWEGGTLINAEALAELTRAQIAIPIEPRPAELSALTPQFYAYGLGWFLRDYRGRRVVLHTGGVDGVVTLAAFVPVEKLGVVVLTNQEEPLISAALYHVLDQFLGSGGPDWFAAYQAWRQRCQAESRAAQTAREQARVPGTRPSLPLEAYAGGYTDPLYGEARVALEAGQLVLRFEHSPCFTGDLEHWHYDTFRIAWRDPMVPAGLVTFPLTARAVVDALVFDQPRLLDVDFAELNFRREAQPHAA